MWLTPHALLFGATLVGVMAAIGLLYEWQRARRSDTLLWWAASLALAALGFLLFAIGGDSADDSWRMLGNYLLLAGAGAMYSGARRLNGRQPVWLVLVIGPTIWLAISGALGANFFWRVTTLSLLHSAYAAIAAFELLRSPMARVAEQRFAGLAIALFSFGHFVRALTGPNILPGGKVDASLNGGWVGPIALTSTIYFVAISVLILRAVRKGGQIPDPAPAALTGARSRQIP